MKFQAKLSRYLLTLTAFGSILTGSVAAQTKDGGGEFRLSQTECLTETDRQRIFSEISKNEKLLNAQGKLSANNAPTVGLITSWMVKPNTFVTDFAVDAISNFVDHNPNFPNQVTDYNCGTRSYDTSAGYNHKGIDISTFPFGWSKMARNEAVAVAAADGVIVNKEDGNFDQNCAFNNLRWNAVYVRHADGTTAWYGHLKSGSLTSKAIGETVQSGEFLGIVGSSGNSTGPHLHFELYNAANQLQDPYQGTCNTLNGFTYFANQPTYRVSRINKLMTHFAAPSLSQCPAGENPRETKIYRNGATGIFAAYYRDQMTNQVTTHSLIKPDGATHLTWTHASPSTYSSSYWYFTRALATNSPGVWKHRAVFEGQTYENTFRVVSSAALRTDFDGDGRDDVSVFRPSNGVWYINNTTGGFSAMQFGSVADKVVPADFDGDLRTDIAVYRGGNWYINRSTQGFYSTQFGLADDIPVPNDFSGDGNAELAVFRPSNGTWYILNLADNSFRAVQFGVNGDRPTSADFDGDGRADIGVYRPSNGVWYVLRSSDSQVTGFQFGAANDLIVPADYDGDSKADYAVYRPSNGVWYINGSAGNVTITQFGITTDLPTPADFDGDGKTDIGVYRGGNWYYKLSSSGISGTQFGSPNDQPAANAFVR